MIKQPKLRKLNLKRETLVPLQSAELSGVAGGGTPATIIAVSVALTVVFCFPTPAK